MFVLDKLGSGEIVDLHPPMRTTHGTELNPSRVAVAVTQLIHPFLCLFPSAGLLGLRSPLVILFQAARIADPHGGGRGRGTSGRGGGGGRGRGAGVCSLFWCEGVSEGVWPFL